MDRPRAELFDAGSLRSSAWPARLAAFWPRTPSTPVCLIAGLTGDAVLIGRFQSAATALRGLSPGAPSDSSSAAGSTKLGLPVARRATGGRALRLGDGCLAIAIVLPRTGALLADGRDVPAAKIVNRFVRPALGMLAASGVSAGWFGRDFISAASKPVAHVSFDAGADGSALIEVHLGVDRCVSLDASEPRWASLREIAPDRFAQLPPIERWIAHLRRGFEERLGAILGDAQAAPGAGQTAWPAVDEDLPSRASRLFEIPIGTLEARVELDDLAGRRLTAASSAATDETAMNVATGARKVLGRVRLLGDFQADAASLAALEASLRGCPATFEQVGARIDALFGAHARGTIVGLKTLAPLAEAIVDAAG